MSGPASQVTTLPLTSQAVRQHNSGAPHAHVPQPPSDSATPRPRGGGAGSETSSRASRASASALAPKPMEYMFGVTDETLARRAVWESPGPVRPGGPGGKDIGAYCKTLEATVKKLRESNAALEADSDSAYKSELQTCRVQLMQQSSRLNQASRAVEALVAKHARLEGENRKLARERGLTTKRHKGHAAGTTEEARQRETAENRAAAKQAHMQQKLRASNQKAKAARGKLADRDRQVLALDDQVVEARLAQAEGLAALDRAQAKHARSMQTLKEDFASTQSALRGAASTANARREQSSREVKVCVEVSVALPPHCCTLHCVATMYSAL